jgi:DNA-binding PadR family transcriptional regulator
MRSRPPWLGKYDEPILEFLAESNVAAPPAVVAFNLDWHGIASPAYSTVKRRMRKLNARGLLEKVDTDSGYYAITDKGQSYLAGDLDPGDLEQKEQ